MIFLGARERPVNCYFGRPQEHTGSRSNNGRVILLEGVEPGACGVSPSTAVAADMGVAGDSGR